MKPNTFFHSVTLDRDKCIGCSNCIKRCPTEAIRVQKGKAKILSDRCIDCGECIRVCPHHAKIAKSSDLDAILKSGTYTIALPAPSLYSQFNNLENTETVLNALLSMGFDDVYDVGAAAEIISSATRALLEDKSIPHPIISSACPTIVRLIRIRFPQLIENLAQLLPPVELAARLAKERAHEEKGIPYEDIKTVFLSPCPAKVTASIMPLATHHSEIDEVVAIRDVYPPMLSVMKEEDSTDLSHIGRMGMGWGTSGGEASATLNDHYLAVDGIENCIKVLEGLEDERFPNLDFVEMNACPGGCVGGVLMVENPYIAKVKLKQIKRYLPVSLNGDDDGSIPDIVRASKVVEYEPVMELDKDLKTAMTMMAEIDKLSGTFRGLDCGSCGAPTCRALAEDIVRGYNTQDACVFKMRESMKDIAKSLAMLGSVNQVSDDSDDLNEENND